MTEQRKEIVGSYLMEEEAMDKVNWLKGEGYRSEEIWLIRDQRGVLEQLGEEPITREPRSVSSEQTDYTNLNATSSVVSPGSLLTPESKSVAATLMELGIDKQEAYRYEFDVKVGKMLILADPAPMQSRNIEVEGSRMDRYMENEEPALMEDDDSGSGVEPGVSREPGAGRSAKGVVGSPGYRDDHRKYEDNLKAGSTEREFGTSERHVEIDGRENFTTTSDEVGSPSVSGRSINRPLTDTNIDGSIPLDEQLLTGEPVDMEKAEKDFAREELISLHDQASVTNEAPPMHREDTRAVEPDDYAGGPNTGKRYAENKTEEDVDKALLYEHGQPFPMEKPYEEDVYDENVMADGPLHVEEVPGDATATEREEPLFRSEEGVRPKSGLEQEQIMAEENRGPILFEDTLNEIERDKPTMEMEPGLEEHAPIGTEQPGDLYTPEHEETVLGQEESDLYTESDHTYENETSVFEEEDSELFSSRKKEQMNTKRSGLFDKENDDLFRKNR
ncbi:hypothetical protein AB685_08275 [Bacillus sp. LL01]|uniref:general stress protein n=1 Tax=Bacillus sp. LL01 TaxID=1665556 RepID=UPI00064D10BF|nr:general stress protein [Bacillus sp. LL01]KMJ59054.1 hypothetical protein AB685_08275 [Bacillus sp. LL01]